MKNILKKIAYWGQLLMLPFYGLSYLFPRTRKIWVLGSSFGKRFADNPKYFFLYLLQYQSQQVRAIWISKRKEVIKLLTDNHLEGYYLYSVKGIWYSLRAKVYLYDNYSKDISFLLSGGALKINLWHGTPLKKIQKDNIFDYVRNPRTTGEKIKWVPRRISDEKPYDHVLTTSEQLRPIFESAFQTRKVLICGYPRNDNLHSERIKNIASREEQEMSDLAERYKKDHRIAFYMPTFRDSEAIFFTIMDVQRLNTFLKKEHILLIVKPHPKTKQMDHYQKLSGDNIYVIKPQEDPYPMLPLVDLLVTDYSSIYFDYLLTDKPILFFPYDIKEYLRDSREMYFEYEKFTPGPKVYNQEQLEEALLQEDIFEQKRHEILKKTYDDPKAFASEKLFSLITGLLAKR